MAQADREILKSEYNVYVKLGYRKGPRLYGHVSTYVCVCMCVKILDSKFDIKGNALSGTHHKNINPAMIRCIKRRPGQIKCIELYNLDLGLLVICSTKMKGERIRGINFSICLDWHMFTSCCQYDRYNHSLALQMIRDDIYSRRYTLRIETIKILMASSSSSSSFLFLLPSLSSF